MSRKTAVLSIRVPIELKYSISALAEATTRRNADLILTWISEKLEQESWQLQQIEEGLFDIMNDNYASDAEVSQLEDRWGLVL